MTLDDLRDNVEPHAQAGNAFLPGTSGPIEPIKNLVALLSRDAESMIVHTDRDRLWGGGEVHLDRLVWTAFCHLAWMRGRSLG